MSAAIFFGVWKRLLLLLSKNPKFFTAKITLNNFTDTLIAMTVLHHKRRHRRRPNYHVYFTKMPDISLNLVANILEIINPYTFFTTISPGRKAILQKLLKFYRVKLMMNWKNWII